MKKDHEKRIKDLEDIYRNFTDDHEGRITTLENRLNVHVRSEVGETGDRIKALEDLTHEESKFVSHLNNEMIFDKDRIGILERWKNKFEEDRALHFMNDIKDFDEMNKRIKVLENSSKVLQEQVNGHFLCKEDHGCTHGYIHELGQKIENLQKRQLLLIRDVESLEKWKERYNPCPSEKACYEPYIKIPKQAWEDLKRMIGNMYGHMGVPFTYRDAFANLIKRVEPDWDP